MSKRIPGVIIEDILESIGKVMSYTKGMEYTSFLNDTKTKEAVYRNFEVMREVHK